MTIDATYLLQDKRCETASRLAPFFCSFFFFFGFFVLVFVLSIFFFFFWVLS